MVLIDALYINKGGGAVLLQYLIETILRHRRWEEFFFVLDPRFDKPAALEKNFVVIDNKISARRKFYRENKDKYSKVLCFANTPPPIKLKVPVYTYFQNQKLLEAPKHKFKREYFSQYLKFRFVKLFNGNTDCYIVQTPHMAQMLTAAGLQGTSDNLIIPFYDEAKYAGDHDHFSMRVKDEFVFVSNPSVQKNHSTLLDAWEYLLAKGHTPGLHVTIDDTAPHLTDRVEKLNKHGARIKNHINSDPRFLYFRYPYLIFPSTMESFGLPLLEAVDGGMKVLASDLPYVYDVVVPSLTFNPRDKVSIADAVLKALSTELPFSQIVIKNEVGRLVDLLIS